MEEFTVVFAILPRTKPFSKDGFWERTKLGLEDYDEVYGVWELAPPVLMLHARSPDEGEALFEIHFDCAWAEPLFCPLPRFVAAIMAFTKKGIIGPCFGFKLRTREHALWSAHALLDLQGDCTWLPEPLDATSWFLQPEEE